MELGLEEIGLLLGIILTIILIISGIIKILEFLDKRKKDKEKKREELLKPLYKDVKDMKKSVERFDIILPFVNGKNTNTRIKFAKISEEFPKIGRMIKEFDEILKKMKMIEKYHTARQIIEEKIKEKYEKESVFKSDMDAIMLNPKNPDLINDILTGRIKYISNYGYKNIIYIEFIKKYENGLLKIRGEIKEIKECEEGYKELNKKIRNICEEIQKELKIKNC